MKIFCIGRNYVNHAKELNNAVPESPVVFMKPRTAILKEDKPFYHPDWTHEIHYELELVIRLCKNGKHVEEKFASNYYDRVTVGVDLTARDVQAELKAKGLPWEKAKGFDASAIIGKMVPLSTIPNLQEEPFRLTVNGETRQVGQASQMIFSIDYIISYISKYFTLHQGDVIYTGTPAGVGKINMGDELSGFLGERKLFTFEVR